MKLIRELRRREVFRTAGLYIGIAWIVIEGSSVLLPAFEAPEWILRALIIVAIVGLPVVIVLAWIYDITDKGIQVQDAATDTVVVPFGGRKMDFIVIGLLTVALIFSVYMNIEGDVETDPTDIPPVSVLIADFDNKTGDPLFDGTLEQALQIGIESAPYVAGYRRDAALRLAKTLDEDTAGLNEASARLVAVREGIKLVLAGSIEEDGDEYTLFVRALDPRAGEIVTSVEAEAGDKSEVLTAIGTLSGDLREELGNEDLDREELIAKETFTAKNLEAAKAYSQAQSLQYSGKYDEAMEFYEEALSHDPNFGRAYSGLALSAHALGRSEEADELWKKALSTLNSMTERERLRTLGLYYSVVTRNFDKAIETYQTLVEKYPADDAAHNGLAVQYFFALDFDKAREAGAELLDIYPNSVMGRSNYALYAMYSTDFETAVAEAAKVRELDESYFKAWLPVAIKALAEGDVAAARDAYGSMQPLGTRGELTAQLGLADVSMFAGEFDRARAEFSTGVEMADEVGSSYFAATMRIGLAEALLRGGADPARVVEMLQSALDRIGGLPRQVPAALMYLEIGDVDSAQAIAAALKENLQPQNRAYARLIEGVIALKAGNAVTAVDSISAGIELADLWLLRLYRGMAYLEAGFAAESLDEFTTCYDRRGEASAIFLDDLPTFRYAAALPAWIDQAQQALGINGKATGEAAR